MSLAMGGLGGLSQALALETLLDRYEATLQKFARPAILILEQSFLRHDLARASMSRTVHFDVRIGSVVLWRTFTVY